MSIDSNTYPPVSLALQRPSFPNKHSGLAILRIKIIKTDSHHIIAIAYSFKSSELNLGYVREGLVRISVYRTMFVIYSSTKRVCYEHC